MSTIIKSSGRGDPVGAPFHFTDLAAPTSTSAAQTCAQVAEILAAAEVEAARIRQHAEQQGREAGLADVKRSSEAKIAAEVQTLLPVLRKMVEELGDARQACFSHWEKQAIHLAAAMARRIVRRELMHQPDIPLALVSEALELVAGKPEVRILLNPEDHQHLHETALRLATEIGRAARAEVIADPSVSHGGCRVETRQGMIDQTFEAQLDRIERELT